MFLLVSDTGGWTPEESAEVIGGRGAFVKAARSIDDFAEAVRKTLIREIEDRKIVNSLDRRRHRWFREGPGY